MSDFNDMNKKIIEEFRANEGKVGGHFADMTLLLLHTVGAKSGKPRINPVATIAEDDSYVIIASKAGADTHPAWYHNLVANPDVRVEVGADEFPAQATITDEPERTELYSKVTSVYPGFSEYQRRTTRVIPVIKLSRQA